MSEEPQAVPPELVVAVAQGDRTLREALALEDSSLESTAAYGYHALEAGYFEVAREVFEGLLALDPYVPFFYLGLGSALRGLGDKRLAFQNFEKARLLAPEDLTPYLNQAEMLVEDKKLNEARQLLQSISKTAAKSKHPLAAPLNQLLLNLSQLGA